MNYWESYKYKNLSIFAASLIFAFSLSKYKPFVDFVLGLGDFGITGAFLGGMLFVLSSTVGIGVVILSILTDKLSILEETFFAALGAVLGDLIIFRFVKDNLAFELESLYQRFGADHLSHVLNSKYFHWTLPIIGAFIIASPFPDELGVTLIGISKMKTYQFILLSFVMNATGIFLVVLASTLF